MIEAATIVESAVATINIDSGSVASAGFHGQSAAQDSAYRDDRDRAGNGRCLRHEQDQDVAAEQVGKNGRPRRLLRPHNSSPPILRAITHQQTHRRGRFGYNARPWRIQHKPPNAPVRPWSARTQHVGALETAHRHLQDRPPPSTPATPKRARPPTSKQTRHRLHGRQGHHPRQQGRPPQEPSEQTPASPSGRISPLSERAPRAVRMDDLFNMRISTRIRAFLS